MTAPPEPGVVPSPPDMRRNWSGWIALGALLFLTLIQNVAVQVSEPARFKAHDSAQEQLRHVLSVQSLDTLEGHPFKGPADPERGRLGKALEDSLDKMTLQGPDDELAAMLYAEMRTFCGQPVPVAKLKPFAKSRHPEDRAFYQIYKSSRLTQDDARKLMAQLPAKPFVYQVARVQALERAGDIKAVTRYFSPLPVIGESVIEAVALPFLAASIFVWLLLRRKVLTKTLNPKGIPFEAITPLDADRLAIRAAQTFAVFILLTTLSATLALGLRLHVGLGMASAVGGVLTIVCIYCLQNVPVMGKQIRLADLGVTRANLARDIGLGVMGFLAEFPVAAILADICAVMLRFLPQPTHPAAEALEQTRDPATVISLLILGCVIAPFWEEIAFRGLIFPGLNRLLGGIVPGILVSSFLFAAVHPQGVAGWIPLAFVGVASCFLARQSRSLIPGMVMHGLHNGAIFAIILLS